MSEQHIERHRIHSVITRSAILHVEDRLEIGKLRLFALAYKRGQGPRPTPSTSWTWPTPGR